MHVSHSVCFLYSKPFAHFYVLCVQRWGIMLLRRLSGLRDGHSQCSIGIQSCGKRQHCVLVFGAKLRFFYARPYWCLILHAFSFFQSPSLHARLNGKTRAHYLFQKFSNQAESNPTWKVKKVKTEKWAKGFKKGESIRNETQDAHKQNLSFVRYVNTMLPFPQLCMPILWTSLNPLNLRISIIHHLWTQRP